MTNAREIYTLSAEAAAARLRGLLTTEKPPSSGAALKARLHQPPSEIVTNNYRKLPYEQRMWSPEGIDEWCAERQPPRIRKALACLDRLEGLEAGLAPRIRKALACLDRAEEMERAGRKLMANETEALDDAEMRGAVMQLDTVEEILAAGDEP